MRAPLLLGTVVLTAALAGCSLGRSDFNGNRPDVDPSQQELVRTPSPVGTDLPYTDPPLEQPLPGPSGGAPGAPPTTDPPASPGGGSDGVPGIGGSN